GAPRAGEAQDPRAAPPPPDARNDPASAAQAPKAIADEPAEAAKTEGKEKKDERPSASPEEVAVTNEQPQQAKQRSNQQRNADVVSPDDSRNQTRSAANSAQFGLSNNGSRAGSPASTPREDRDKTERGGGASASRRARSAGESRAQGDDDEVT